MDDKEKATLKELIKHTLQCEKRLDEFCGLGKDAGSGCSDVVVRAQALLEQKD